MTRNPGGRTARLTSIDTLRGIVMILMALDHVRDYLGAPPLNPLNLANTTVPLFLTRWVTHLCAPTFFLLTGTSAFLARPGRSTSELSRFLFLRGLWLIVLELTVIRCLGMQFNVDYQVTMLIVIWALGWAMIVLSALVWLPTTAILIVGAVMVGGHNMFDGVRSAHPLWVLLHGQGVVVDRPQLVIFVAYPLIPWVGVTALGYAFGQIYEWDAARRRAFLLRCGVACIAVFAVLRGFNIYGNPVPWSTRASTAFTVLSFLNVTKQPPSLLFLLITLGLALLLLSALDQRTPRPLQPALVFGRVPLFYFVLHLPLIHLFAVIACYAMNGAVHWMFESPTLAVYPFTPPPVWGLSLPWVYLAWATVVVTLYPACAWFASVKQRRRDWWLSYL